MQTQTVEQLKPRFLMRMTICDDDPVDAREVQDVIECLGGIGYGDCFAFNTARARAIALEVLGDKFGTRYVCSVRKTDGIGGVIASKDT